MFYYNPRNIDCKKPFGAVDNDTPIEFSLYAKDGVFVNAVYLAIAKDGEDFSFYQMKFKAKHGDTSQFSTKFCVEEKGLYFYHFSIVTENGTLNLYKGNNAEVAEDGAEYQLSVFDAKFTTPDYIKGGVIYHIFVDRFAKGKDENAVFEKNGVLKEWGEAVTVVDSDGVFRANDFYGGNFQGIIDKLDYLESLGVTLLYLSPIFKSGSNHRYDTGDYMSLDELLGNEEKFSELLDKAKARRIYVMLDGVFNHTGADSLYFNKFGNYPSVGAYQSKDSPYHNWFHFSEFPDNYDCWWGITVTPTVNKRNPDFKKLIVGAGGVIEKYTTMGVKGWRLDVVDELDSAFVESIRGKIKSLDKDALLIGEVWEDASNKTSYSLRRPYLWGDELDGTMNYPFKEAILDYVCHNNVQDVYERMYTILENYPKQCLDVSMNLIGTHDTWRAINRFMPIDVSYMDKKQKDSIVFSETQLNEAKNKLKLASVLQFTVSGTPSIYYGDEVGLDGYDDPLNRKTFPWDNIDKDVLTHFTTLGNIRKKHKEVFADTMKLIKNDDFLIVERGEGKLLVVCNNDTYSKSFYINNKSKELLSNRMLEGEIIIPPCSALILLSE